MNIAQISTYEVGGGAEKVANELFKAYRARRHESYLVVGRKASDEPAVIEIPVADHRSLLRYPCLALRRALSSLDGRVRGVARLRGRLERLAEGWPAIERRLGREDFSFPGSRRLLELLPKRPDIVHAHNLHGAYFDLRALAAISQKVPVALTLHDEWLWTGHCAHTLGCERWESGCGHCPNLGVYWPICRDASAWNWRRKRDIYRRSRLFVCAPSRWLLDRAERSILAPIEGRVINNGIDLKLFKPGDRRAARQALGLPQDTDILLFTANRGTKSPFKDYTTIRDAVGLLAQSGLKRAAMLVELGGDSRSEEVGAVPIWHVPFESDPARVALYYQAADLYVHAAKADTFPTVVLEALACGTPVVATAVGGIPEQVRGLHQNGHTAEHATGMLVPPGSADAMAQAIAFLLADDSLRLRLAENAAADAKQRFDLNRAVDEYLSWYQEIVAKVKQ